MSRATLTGSMVLNVKGPAEPGAEKMWQTEQTAKKQTAACRMAEKQNPEPDMAHQGMIPGPDIPPDRKIQRIEQAVRKIHSMHRKVEQG